ncbi:hypothetical protein LSH36_43g05052 [Paralvinella palmiformis]|uniref:Transmembrane protein 254 n=1 Tax=Paralvinella palmiformis TaxID=53620 RepID=A0AAD9K8N5_9ANNE|nr:hypothetical protein LSH36_43g05052 [Paralvinella palmiformis]
MAHLNPVADVRESRYFRTPHILALVLVPLGMALLTVTYLIPDRVPYDCLGPIGKASYFMANYLPTVLKVIFYGAWSGHAIEAWLAVKLCRQKGIHPDTTRWWAVQTFFYGIFSFSQLIKYDPAKDD